MSPSSEPQVVSDEVKQKYINILKANGIKDEVKTISIYEPDALKGEHFAALSTYVKVEFSDPSKKPKNLFVKSFVENEVHKSMVQAMRIMEKESYFFMNFLPAAREFAKTNAGCEDLLSFFPKCFHGDDDMVVLDNVVLDDTFVMLPKEEYQDLDTAKLVLTHLAKFHGVGAAMIEDMGREKFRAQHSLLIYEAMMSAKNPFILQMFDNAISTAINILTTNPVEGGQKTIETLSGYLGKAFGMVDKLFQYDPDQKMHVINHGDCWGNNMLFKLDSEGKVVDHIFIDLQITRMGSPCLDIAYFLNTSVKPKVRRGDLKVLLQHYYENLRETLGYFNRQCPLTFEEFFDDYKKHHLYGFFFNINCMVALGALKEMDVNEMGTDQEKAMEIFTKIIENWVKNNPVRSTEISTELVAALKEFKELTGTT